MPPEDYEPILGPQGVLQNPQSGYARRLRYVRTKLEATRIDAPPDKWRVPAVESRGGRTLLPSDDRETWLEAGVPEHVVDEYFPEPEDGRGHDRLHRWITPEVVARVVSEVDAALEHLKELPPESLADHFTEVYGEVWPPHLEEIHPFLVDRFRGGYREKGTALRVAMRVPMWTWETAPADEPLRGEPEDVFYYNCPLDFGQLQSMLRQAE